jgi:O-acetyl-ADP-ribose deacetylase (regulator of RNase III)
MIISMTENKLKLVKGDITQMQVDAIVNATNTALENGAGVNGAIHQAAGPELAKACHALGGCSTGQARITKGYLLPAKYVIHAVGPIWRGGNKGEPKLLASCYHESLKLALENNIKTIAFPALSCGVFGYPILKAAIIAIKETANFLELHEEIMSAYFVCFDDSVYEAYKEALDLHYYE